MLAVRSSLARQFKVVVAVLAATVIGMTSLVVAAPSADAAYKLNCVVSKHVIRRGEQDAVFCRHGARLHSGSAYIVRKRRPHIVVLKRFRTGPRGNALFAFRARRQMHLGRNKVFVQVARQRTFFFVVVHARRRR